MSISSRRASELRALRSAAAIYMAAAAAAGKQRAVNLRQ
jgi:hypothetical protein